MSNFPCTNEYLKLNSKFIVPLSMLFITAAVAADAVAFKFTNVFSLNVSGATLIFPLTYLLGDVITEVYGYNVSKLLIWYSLICELIFSFAVQYISKTNILPGFQHQNEYNHVFGGTLRFVFSGIIADLVSSFFNSYIISKYKKKFAGKKFWFRSITATLLSQLIQALIIIPMAFGSVSSIAEVIKIMWSAYCLEIGYAILFVWPAWFLIKILKRYDGYDAYDFGVNYNPFKFRI